MILGQLKPRSDNMTDEDYDAYIAKRTALVGSYIGAVLELAEFEYPGAIRGIVKLHRKRKLNCSVCASPLSGLYMLAIGYTLCEACARRHAQHTGTWEAGEELIAAEEVE